MKIFTFISTLFLTVASYAQLSLSPAPVSGQIALTQANTYIYISSTTAQTLSLSLVGSGITISSNRCSSLRANSSCYIIVAVSNYSTNSSALSVDLKNGSTTLATLTVAPVAKPESSVFTASSLQMDGFSNYSFTIQNKTQSVKSYSPVIGGVDASKYSIQLNRCTSVAVSGTCSVTIKLAPQLAGSYSATITEPQVTGSLSLSSTITNATPGAIQPPNPSITMTPSSQSFGTITSLGKTAAKSFTITNNGNVAVSPIIAVVGTGLEISLNRCLVLLSPAQSCTVSVLFNAVSSMTNGVQSGLSVSAQATSSTTLLTSTLSASLSVNPVLLASSGGAIGAGLSTSILINSNGGNVFFYSGINKKLYTWGSNGYYGLVGDGTNVDRSSPYSIMNYSPLVGTSLKDFSFYDDHACMLTTDNNIYCWGYNYAGQASPILDGFPVSTPALIPKGDMGSKTIKKLAIGDYMSLALSDDGHVYFWGANGAGQSGSIDGQNPSPADIAYCGSPYGQLDCQTIIIPKEIKMDGELSGKVIKDVTATYTNICVITTSNQVYCWGSNYGGNVGNGTNIDVKFPTEIKMDGALAGKTIKKLYMSDGTNCVMTTEDLLYCWGGNYFGQLGTGSTNYSENTPQPVVMTGSLAGKTVKQYYPGSTNPCMIASDDQAYCWGWNHVGQVGVNSMSQYTYSTPQPVDTSGALAGKTIKKMSIPYVGGYTICAIASDDKLYCWGSNQAGQLGDGTTNDSSTPLATDPNGILAGKTILEVSSQGGGACVIASDNKVYCIGANYNGQLGIDNSIFGYSSSTFVLAPTVP